MLKIDFFNLLIRLTYMSELSTCISVNQIISIYATTCQHHSSSCRDRTFYFKMQVPFITDTNLVGVIQAFFDCHAPYYNPTKIIYNIRYDILHRYPELTDAEFKHLCNQSMKESLKAMFEIGSLRFPR